MNQKECGKKETERENRQKNLNEFNSITQKVKPENQNQQHNVREEGIGPINRKLVHANSIYVQSGFRQLGKPLNGTEHPAMN